LESPGGFESLWSGSAEACSDGASGGIRTLDIQIHSLAL
jgi:hypothetical protein